jgi:hypothetical protein
VRRGEFLAPHVSVLGGQNEREEVAITIGLDAVCAVFVDEVTTRVLLA